MPQPKSYRRIFLGKKSMHATRFTEKFTEADLGPKAPKKE